MEGEVGDADQVLYMPAHGVSVQQSQQDSRAAATYFFKISKSKLTFLAQIVSTANALYSTSAICCTPRRSGSNASSRLISWNGCGICKYGGNGVPDDMLDDMSASTDVML
jgi:hypothetical protein